MADEMSVLKNKRICFVTTVSITLKSFVLETAKHLHENFGAQVTFICSPDEAFAASLPPYIRYIPVDMPRGADLSGFRSIKTFRRIFRQEKFDLVQYSTPNASCYASIAARLERVPIRLYCQWGIRYVGLSGASRIVFKLLEKLVCRCSTRIHAVSHKNMQFALEQGLYKADRARVVGNGGTIGVDMAAYDVSHKQERGAQIRCEYGLDENDFVFGFAGRVSADKGCAELLTAFREIQAEHPRARLLVVGPMEERCGVDAELIAFATESDRVVLTGKIDNARMKDYYAAMDCLVHPTYREGFGMVIQEAGALAVPAITTNIPGASEVMVDGESCLLAEPKNASQLKQAMLCLLCDEERAQALGQAAYERTRRLYDRPIMLEHQRLAYEQLFQSQE